MQRVRFDPLRLGGWRVSVDHHRRSPIVLGPVISDRESELVRFAGGFSVESKLSHRPGCAALQVFFEPGVSHYQLAVIENEVAHQAVDEPADFVCEVRWLSLHLLKCFREAVGDAHILACEFAHELNVVVSGNA